jgi:hypothetical protein
MLIVVRGFVAVALLAGALSWSVTVPAATGDQTVTAIEQVPEQRVEGIAPQGEQRVENLTAEQAEQTVNGTAPKSGAQRAASTAGKIALGVMAAVVSIATMAASLLFF